MAELRELADGRTDLLAEVAGIFEGTSEGEMDEPLCRQAARLCRRAGADPEAIPAWIEEGKTAPGIRQKAAVFRGPTLRPEAGYRRVTAGMNTTSFGKGSARGNQGRPPWQVSRLQSCWRSSSSAPL